jgi:RecA-family ATPase
MFTPLDAYLNLPRAPQPWVVEKLIPVGGLVNVFGKPKTGKSFFALGLAQAIINGDTDWQGYPIQMHGPVAYLQIDTPREEWHSRLSKLRFQPPSATQTLWMADMWQVPEFPFNILNPQRTEVRWLKESLDTIKPVLTVIDTLREVHGGDENDSTTMRNVLAELVGACRPSAILLLSHARKDSILTTTGEDDLMDQGRGSSYVAGRMDVVIKLTPKRMVFKGRATGQTVETISQDTNTGLIVIDAGPNDGAVTHELRSVIADLGPGASQRAIATELAKRTRTSVSTGIRRLNAYNKEHAPSTSTIPLT